MVYNIGDNLVELPAGNYWRITNKYLTRVPSWSGSYAGADLMEYDLEDLCTGNALRGWPQQMLDDRSAWGLYVPTAGDLYMSCDSSSALVGHWRLVGPRGPPDVWGAEFLGNTQQYANPYLHPGDLATVLLTEPQWILMGKSTHATCSVPDSCNIREDTPMTEGQALMQFWATPAGEWRGWSDV